MSEPDHQSGSPPCGVPQVPHHLVGALADTVERVAGWHLPQTPDTWQLERYVSQNYMGLFLDEAQSELLKKLTGQLARELARQSQ